MTTKNLILLPGLMCDAAVWAPQVAALSGQIDCEVADYGLLDSLTDMAQQVLASTSAASFALAGHSMGGRIALEIWRLAPQRVARLALLDTGTAALPGGEAGEKERAGRLALVALAQQQGMRVMGAQWAAGMVHPDVPGTPVFESLLQMLARSSPAQFAAQTRALLSRPDATALLPHITCPTLVLTGSDDLWSPPVQHALMADRIAQAQLCVIEHCGHMSTLEQPEAVSASMAAWLTGVEC